MPCELWAIELTVCFETSYEEAHSQKTTRYVEQITSSNFDGELVTLEVGSHGFLSLPTFTTLQLELSKKQWREFLNNVVQAAIKGSHRVWVMWNWPKPLS